MHNHAVYLMLLSALAGAPASAACSRTLNVPVSATGMSLAIVGQSVEGIYPEIVRGVSAKTGCQFKYNMVPRARAEALFENGKSDLMMPATRTPRRDQHGFFVPMVSSRATLITLEPLRPGVKSIAELRDNTTLRLALVRGFDYGEAYLGMIKELSAKGRLFLEPDIVGVARLLQAGYADVTIMSPVLMAGAIATDERVEKMRGKLHLEPLEELPWGESGIYISRATLSKADVSTLEAAFSAAAKSPAVYDAYKRYYPPEILNESIRPRQ